jgi:DNA-binding transcriptional regulator LsrR (DeoR family)
VSITPQQRAQVLYLYHVEAMSAVMIALMTGLSFCTVRRVVQKARRKDVPAVEKAAAMRPQSKGRLERQIRYLRDQSLQCPTAVPPPRRGHRKEVRHDRT